VSDPAERTTMERLIGGVYPAMALLAGMQLDLFTAIPPRGASAAEIAGKLSVESELLAPLLDALVVAGLLKRESESYLNSAETQRLLVRGTEEFCGDSHTLIADIWSGLMRTTETIRSGRPQAKHAFAEMPRESLDSFFEGIHPGALSAGRELAQRFDLSQHRRLLDVGGGSGGLSIAACRAAPHLAATVVDLPSVVPVTEGFVERAGLDGRIRVDGCDVVAGAPQGRYDLVALRSVLQVLGREDAARALANVGHAVEPGGRLYLRGQMLDDSGLTPPATVGFNLVFLNFYDEGRAHGEADYREWLIGAGFDEIERTIQPDGNSTITARKR